MKKIIKGLLILTFCISITSCKHHSSENSNSTNSTAQKCPNCASTAGYHPDPTIPSLKICNTCGIGY